MSFRTIFFNILVINEVKCMFFSQESKTLIHAYVPSGHDCYNGDTVGVFSSVKGAECWKTNPILTLLRRLPLKFSLVVCFSRLCTGEKQLISCMRTIRLWSGRAFSHTLRNKWPLPLHPAFPTEYLKSKLTVGLFSSFL